MVTKPVKWIRIHINKITQSIAFYPAIIAICFLLLSWGMLKIDFSPWGKQLKQHLSWLSLKDASTGRTIISTVAGAIISLTVFSFSMVMIVLNQAASQMSNRVLSSMIENRFQQIVLGCYIGTIVYALFLLSTIRDINSGVYVPALSIYLLILLTVIDIFLFIYFLDYVTQTVKYETVIRRVQSQTIDAMKTKFCTISYDAPPDWSLLPHIALKTSDADYFQGFNQKRLLEIATTQNLMFSILCKPGDFLIKGIPFLLVYGSKLPNKDCINKIIPVMDFYKGQPVDVNPDYGFHQLAEVAIKALSPGINDPATAVISLHALTDLLSFRLSNCLPLIIKDQNGIARIHVNSSTFDSLFIKCIYPIWNYGQKDQYIQNELKLMLAQLEQADAKHFYQSLFNDLLEKINKKIR